MKFKIEKSKDDYEILKVIDNEREVYIGSKYNQKREIDKLVKEFEIENDGYTYVIIGLGSVKAVEAVCNEGGYDNVVCLEFNKDIIEIFKREKGETLEKLNIIKEAKEFREFVEKINVRKIKTLTFSNYNKVLGKEVKVMFEELKSYVERKIVDDNTRKYFANQWFENDFENSKELYKSEKVNNLKGKFKDKPCIIVSAGPSLEKNIDKIDRSKTYVMSGGRTLRSLMEQDIKCDFLVVTDGGKWSYVQVKDKIEETDAILVYTNTTNKEIVKYHKGKKIVAAKESFIKTCIGEIEDISVGGSVANSMAYLAAYLGFNPIIFVGQDLAYTDEKGHASSATTFKGASVEGENGYYREDDLYVKDIYGNRVRTSIELNQFRISMEEVIEKFKEVEFINATEGGANIRGANNKKLEDVMKSLKTIKREELVKSVCDLNVKRKVEKNIELNIKNLKVIKKYTKQGAEILEEVSRKIKGNLGINGKLKELDKIDFKLKKEIRETYLLENKLFKVLDDLENNPKYKIEKNLKEDEKLKIMILRNRDFYREIYKICEEVLSYLKKSNEIM